jgi:hypothetical protein
MKVRALDANITGELQLDKWRDLRTGLLGDSNFDSLKQTPSFRRLMEMD